MSISQLLPDLPAGIHQHYKSPLYQTLGYAHDANIENRIVVVYFGLQLDQAHDGPRLAVRTADDFHTMVCRLITCPRYGVSLNGYDRCRACATLGVPRFRYIAPDYRP